MRPVRFEPTTLGLGNRIKETFVSLLLKLFAHEFETVGDQKVDQTFHHETEDMVNQRLNRLPNTVKRLVVSIFSESQKPMRTK